MRLAYYAGGSTLAAAVCLLKAFHQRPNFYSATVYLSQSNACLLILTNLLLVCAGSFMYALQRLLYGPLRPIEIEQLSEKAWYAVLDTLLAMPSFREDVGGWLLAMFVLLLAGKVWGWIGEGRVDILEQQPPANPKLFHARLATSLILSVVFDLYMFNYCVETVLADPRPGMMVIFTFEFAVLAVFSIFTLCRYGLSVVEGRIVKQQTREAVEARKDEIRAERAAARRNEAADGTPAPAPVPSPTEEPIHVDEEEIDVPGWEEKRRFLFILEVVTDFLKLLIYVVFFTISITFNGLPMHIMRDVYMTFAGFSKRVNDYMAYRKATSDMNSRYPDATTEEIRGDACIVCRETMVAWAQDSTGQDQPQPAGDQPQAATARRRDEGLRAKKLPCGHILHLRCLKAWLERQQVCPTCRRPVVSSSTPNPAGQPAANAANGAAHGQQEQPGQPGQGRAHRPNRARIFNLGPIRIGFLNGPGDQIQNIVQQMRNQPGAPQNGGQGQGPNHLGLRVPYTAPGVGGIPRSGQATAGSASTQADLMHIEQRLMTEAHNLGIEQQQLATLRSMEGELARLRANVVPGQVPLGTMTAAQRQMQFMQPSSYPGTQTFAAHPFSRPSGDQTLNGTGQQYGSGHENLPTGMTLPEGWSVMPLQRAEPSTNNVASLSVPAGGQSENSAPGPQANGTPSASQPPVSQTEPATVPTDGNGSPLFVPSEHATSDGPAVQSTVSRSQTTSAPIEAQQDVRSDNQAPWQASEPGWDFRQQPNGSAAQAKETDSSQQLLDTANSQSEQATTSNSPDTTNTQRYEGKGKGRAVEVEDVPEPEDGT
ncbi:hypothetical protein MBLNU230_g1294t1 [Neophaeotheca triangularis]